MGLVLEPRKSDLDSIQVFIRLSGSHGFLSYKIYNKKQIC